jgi:hypothetical protein
MMIFSLSFTGKVFAKTHLILREIFCVGCNKLKRRTGSQMGRQTGGGKASRQADRQTDRWTQLWSGKKTGKGQMHGGIDL